MAIDTEYGPITSGGASMTPPEGIDPEGGSDGEQLDASLTVSQTRIKGRVRDGRGSWMLISLTGGTEKRTATYFP